MQKIFLTESLLETIVKLMAECWCKIKLFIQKNTFVGKYLLKAHNKHINNVHECSSNIFNF